jgi:uncharacterized protein YpbB
MDELVFEILWKLEEVRRAKKAKAYFEELSELEELQTKAVLRLMKAKLLIEIVIANEAISKEKLTSDEIKKYLSRKKEAIQNQFKEMHVTLIEDEADLNRYTSKKKDKAAPKKSTVEETFDLWLAKNSIQDIANIRKLSIQTIETHLVKLIQAKRISISEVLPQDKMDELAEAFKYYKEESLSGLKEEHGDKFSWDELKMFKASLN